MLEHTEQHRYKLIDDGGTLLNDRYAESIPASPRGDRKESYKDRLWRLLRAMPITPNALFMRVIPRDTRDQNSPGFAYAERFYPAFGTSITYVELLENGEAGKFGIIEQIKHITWDFMKNKVAFALPVGATIVLDHILPTIELLRELALQLADGTEHEWQRYYSRYWLK
jgi:hypothetical protein